MEKKYINIKGEKYRLLISSEHIKKIVKQIAKQITRQYINKKEPPILLMVTTGGLYFGIELSQELTKLNCLHNIDTIGLRSYGDSQQGGVVELDRRPRAPLKNRDVIVVEDIIDRGSTMNYLNNYLKRYAKPRSIAYCAFCVKKEHGKLNFTIDYQGMKVGAGWLVGYGMDYEQKLRGLHSIYQKI